MRPETAELVKVLDVRYPETTRLESALDAWLAERLASPEVLDLLVMEASKRFYAEVNIGLKHRKEAR